MKKIVFALFILLFILSCKKTEFSAEGPTDVRIRNLSDQDFTQVIISTSEYTEDIDTIASLNKGVTSGYCRFKKAYPYIEISATVNIGGLPMTFSTGPVNYDYYQYIGQDQITYEVYIKSMSTHVLEISKSILEAPLVLK